jgi:hypothetical protein
MILSSGNYCTVLTLKSYKRSCSGGKGPQTASGGIRDGCGGDGIRDGCGGDGTRDGCGGGGMRDGCGGGRVDLIRMTTVSLISLTDE